MQTRAPSQYVGLAKECIVAAAETSNANNRQTLIRMAAIWLRLASDDLNLNEASREAKRGRARSDYLEALQFE